jgi:hypothetical protein
MRLCEELHVSVVLQEDGVTVQERDAVWTSSDRSVSVVSYKREET